MSAVRTEESGTRDVPPVPSASLRSPSLADYAKSAALWAAGLTYFVPASAGMVLTCATLGLDRSLAYQRWYADWVIRLTGSKWRAHVHPDVDPKRPCVFVHNHTNHFDFVLMHNATPHYKRGLELESHFKYPVYGPMMRIRGGIAVKPGVKGQTPEVLANMREALKDGHAILTFPEGHRTTTGRLGPFRKGVFFLARDLEMPVVPVTVTGAYELMRKGSLMIRPGHELTVHVDAPIETAGMSDDEVPQLVDRVHAQMSKHIDDYWRAKGWPG
ncbi:lysophospholipid acyltransferase family protein [Sandaracinus amylolyticus]|uniref:1-acyl-sn-glycerol-3-phosphate acyltransferase n=1 Tax=Sandaracinus amylolyticus TaxID=927083 RepID=A0A0F6YIM9_9BACT|nr:lysophospholipid acyltransferase family protein [Sandaracinus amylolyticus]AKF06326.1 1-acyl-sn-glycerol-3-phosphate acyltransferase [Sandaracinus amylolyticus]